MGVGAMETLPFIYPLIEPKNVSGFWWNSRINLELRIFSKFQLIMPFKAKFQTQGFLRKSTTKGQSNMKVMESGKQNLGLEFDLTCRVRGLQTKIPQNLKYIF